MFLQYFVDREELERNSTAGIKRLKTKPSSRHQPYTKEEMTRIKQACIDKGEHELLLFISFTYYSFIRKSELSELRIEDIKKDKIVVHGSIAKNKKTGFVQIAPGLEKIIQEYKLRECPQNHLIFGKLGFPGTEKIASYFFYERFLKLLEAIGMEKGNRTLYSFKHSGVIALYSQIRNFQDLRFLQEQCRHSSFAMTEKYLRELGLILPTDTTILESFPEF